MGTGSGTNYSTTVAMGLLKPTPGVCGPLGVEPSGKSWMELYNSTCDLVDQHNHTPGRGMQVPTIGLLINADLPFGGYNATGLRSLRMSVQASPLALGADTGCLYVSGSDLYFNDTVGNQVRLTASGGVAGTPGSIGGLASPAAATYTAGSKLFSFTSSSGIGAYLSCGPISIQDPQASGKTVTLAPPVGLVSSYGLTFPGALPGSTLPLTLSAAGVLAAAQITGPQIAAATIAGSNIGSATVARTNLAALGQQVSASSGTFGGGPGLVDVTNLSVTLVTSGRPVMLMVQPDGNVLGNSYWVRSSGGNAYLSFARDGSSLGQVGVVNTSNGAAYSLVDTGASAGSHTYKVQVSGGGGTTNVYYAALVAYEL